MQLRASEARALLTNFPGKHPLRRVQILDSQDELRGAIKQRLAVHLSGEGERALDMMATARCVPCNRLDASARIGRKGGQCCHVHAQVH